MIIKTITCHEVYNHGASLQEYALLQFLKSLGHQAEAVHYKPPYLSNHFRLDTVDNPRFDKPILRQLYLLAKLPSRLRALKRKKAFDLFAEQYIPTGGVCYRSNEALKKRLPEADAYICGSDQIWNSYFQNGKDPAFYLNFVPDNKRKISYAASFAIDQIDDAVKPLVKANVARLQAVSVRETSGVRILRELGLDAIQVLDPVFLLDQGHWEQLLVRKESEPFVFVYDFDSNPIIREEALRLKKTKGLRIFTVNQNIDYADNNFYLEGPECFLALVAQAQYTITNSFHAVAFSLIFEKQFRVVNRKEHINTRMRDLLGLFHLDYLLVSSSQEIDWDQKVEYQKVNMDKESMIARSRQFLLDALNS